MIFTIKPYKTKEGFWTFIDPNTTRTEEENMLVGGIDIMMNQIQAAYGKFSLSFSDDQFLEGNILCSFELHWVHGDRYNNTTSAGNTYLNSETGQEGWLCPVLFDYFEKAPLVIYIKITN
jgi:hypothetical protein